MNIDDLEGLDEDTRKEIEKLLNITREEYGGEAYAESQFEIALALLKKRNFTGAISTWSNIKHSDNSASYARAQFNTGFYLKVIGKPEDALRTWRSISSFDDPASYAGAQLNIGSTLAENSKIQEALIAWGKVEYQHQPKTYSQAQLNIGVALAEMNNIEGALLALDNIKREYDSQTYAQAQSNIGAVLVKSNNIAKALFAWSNIKRTDDPRTFAQAQYNIGIALDKNDDVRGTLSAWNNIRCEDDSELYAQAQFNIGSILLEANDVKGALSIWGNIDPVNNNKVYAQAQYNIGVALEKTDGMQQALSAWENVKHIEDPKTYALAQYKIGLFFINNIALKKYEEAKEAFSNAEVSYPYEAYCYKKICDLLVKPESKFFGEKAIQLLDKTLEIVDILKLDFDQGSKEDKSPERKLAHYTGTHVTNQLLAINEKMNSRSAFRLNTINNVNDPSEGQLLINYFKGIKEKTFYAPNFDEHLHAFISCFTFNHDSLNQFRLYGKQDNKEASGVSLVFNKDFFQSNSSLGGLSFLSIKGDPQKIDIEPIEQGFSQVSELDQSYENIYRINKQPVMRCVYLDPVSGFTQLAQRNKLTFYREFENEKIEKKSTADLRWASYKKEIDKKTKDFNKSFEVLKKIYIKLVKSRSSLDKFERDTTDTLLKEILLPLKYLIKHSAFQEEQECRMVYVTSLNEPEVVMDYGKFLYVEYEADVKTHLDKIYIAPAATQYQPYLAKLLCNSDVRVELSNNPYRQV